MASYYCPVCKQKVASGMRFCSHCGCNLEQSHPITIPDVPVKKDSSSGKLLFTFLVIYVSISVTAHLVQFFYPEWFKHEATLILNTFFGMVQSLCFILPALAIKQKGLRIAGIIISSLFIVWLVAMNVMWLIGSIKNLSYY